MTVLLQEVIKLLSYAKAKDPIIFRIGTCGGLDIPPGSVVISSYALNGTLEKTYDVVCIHNIFFINLSTFLNLVNFGSIFFYLVGVPTLFIEY